MSDPADTDLNFPKIMAWGVVIVLGSVAFVLTAVTIARNAAVHQPGDAQAIKRRIAPVATVTIAAPVAAAAASRSGEQMYKTVCSVCHQAGVANAPKLGDKAAWAPRIALGLDGLLKSAIAGKNAMPPRGSSDASDMELARAIVYMANKAGAGFKEPAAQ